MELLQCNFFRISFQFQHVFVFAVSKKHFHNVINTGYYQGNLHFCYHFGHPLCNLGNILIHHNLFLATGIIISVGWRRCSFTFSLNMNRSILELSLVLFKLKQFIQTVRKVFRWNQC